MSLKLCCAGYVPPPSFLGAKAFVENIFKYKAANELFLISDHADYNFRNVVNPEQLQGVSQHKPWGLNNALFCTLLRMIARDGFTHFIYLESDCRVGAAGWDAIVFEEYFRLPFPAIAAGSLVTHGCINGGAAFYKRFEKMIGDNRNSKQHSIPIYGIRAPESDRNKFPAPNGTVIEPGSRDFRHKPAIYPNGALGVYDVAWLCELFHIKPDGTFKEPHNLYDDFITQPAWDHMIGHLLYDRFGIDVFDVTAHLDSVYSGYGNTLNSESDRLQLLADRKATAVHQIKSEATF